MESQPGQAILVVEAFARDYPIGTRNRVYSSAGPCGVGKTHLAVSALRQIGTCGGIAGFFLRLPGAS